MRVLIAAAALLLAFSVPAAAQYTTGGTIVVTPPTPSAGDSITVAVTGCDPTGGEVAVRIDGVDVGTATVGSDGTFTADFVVPQEAQGPVDVEALCDNGVLGSVITVQVADLPFQDGGAQLPRTGSNSTVVLLRAGVGLLGIGALFLIAVALKRDEYQAAHAGASHG